MRLAALLELQRLHHGHGGVPIDLPANRHADGFTRCGSRRKQRMAVVGTGKAQPRYAVVLDLVGCCLFVFLDLL